MRTVRRLTAVLAAAAALAAAGVYAADKPAEQPAGKAADADCVHGKHAGMHQQGEKHAERGPGMQHRHGQNGLKQGEEKPQSPAEEHNHS